MGKETLIHADVFVLRAPLLALEALSHWAEGLGASSACGEDDEELERALVADRALLRTRLAEIAAEDQVADGLEVASPDLADAILRWRQDPAGKRSSSAERSLVRYVTRAASRPDLFGLAGAYSIGRFSGQARLQLPPRSALEISARVDSGVLRDVVRRAAAEAVDSASLVVRRNGGAYQAGGRLRVAARVPGSAKHRLVAMRPTPAIELALRTAAAGASIESIVAALEAAGSPADHAGKLVRRLIASDFLIPLAQVSVTGSEPTLQAVAALESLPGSEVYARAVQRAISVVSSTPRPGREMIDAVAGALEPTGIAVKRRRCIQVDSKRPGEILLPRRALSEMRRSIDLLARITPPGSNALEAFKEAFERRFATRRVPLLAALDPDFGIRLASSGSAPGQPDTSARATRRRQVLLSLIARGPSRTRDAIELSEQDVAALSRERPAVLPTAFAMLASLRAQDAGAVAAGDFQLVEPTVHGPSGARLLGRLCRADPELEGHVREHLRREAARDPDAIFAELSVAPETEVGLNISQRPVLREWEIEYGGGSGARPDRRLDASDLTVSVEDGEVVVRSVTLDRRVVPSSTTAINPMWLSLPAARFLLSIAHQRSVAQLGWSWDEFADSPTLPRVTHGRTVLALRRWNVTAAELEDIRPGTDAGGFRRLQEWRLLRGLPRLIGFDHPKNRMLVDFGNVLSVDSFLAAAKDVDIVRFVEGPAEEPSPVEGPDGHYAHELIVPFTLEQGDAAQIPRRRAPTSVRESRRRFQPGSEWLYANLYGPVAGADRVLVEHVGPLARSLRETGLVDRWFFIRYADPERHLRVRFHGRPRDLLREVLPALHEATANPMAAGLLSRISLDTYEREIERYGGVEGTQLMEHAAEIDSAAVIDVLGHSLSGVERRHLTVASLAGLYEDAGLPLGARHACCAALRTAWAGAGSGSLGSLLGAEERSERARLRETVAALERDDAEPRIAALRARSAALAPILGRLRALEEEGILERPFDDIICSLAHMGVNRLLKRGANRDELRVHDALARLYEAQVARERVGLA